ncbi:MAG: UvrD-helicase domain-containing protein [Hyphomonadaceae bacterium]|nr:UvrD-helicase domain-containing protein [Hyphomonadaceae bacterium]
MTLVDVDRRKRALTDLGTTLLVEAAAGTGKTSLMAGRVAMLLASGKHPKHVAAITFTEPAAAELALRIRATIEGLLCGDIPKVLAPVLPRGLSPEQRVALTAAAQNLDELTATTIHGFCHTIIRSHAVAAGLDPGLKVMDAAKADAMFDSIFSQWLTDRLSGVGAAANHDPIAVLSESDPLNIAARLHKLAQLRRKHATARPLPMPTGRPDIAFVDAADAFARWHTASIGDWQTAEIVEDLQTLASFFAECLSGTPPFAKLWRLADPPRVKSMRKWALELRPYQRKTAWKKTRGQAGERLNSQAEAHFDSVDRAYRSLLGHIGQALITSTSAALDDMLTRYAQRKRAAAVLDFDDLLLHARDLVAGREDVRHALGLHYQHILVDEFQDTDPIQAEILFLIGAEARPPKWQDAVLRPGSLFLVGDPKQAIYRFRGADIGIYEEARDNVKGRSGGAVVQVTANFRSRRGLIDFVNNRFDPVLSHAEQPGYVPLSHTIEDGDGLPCIAKLTVVPRVGAKADGQRDAEADVVADVCQRLIGAVELDRADGSSSLLRPGDIALLAPTHTDLWHYERALEERGIAVASQAGKSLMLCQETQDVLALMRALYDSRDTLAFGAMMRGPLVGLTDDELLQITAGLPEGTPFTIRTDPESVEHPLAKSVLEMLQRLRRRAAVTTPLLLLSEAIEQLQVRVVLAARHRNRNARAMANIDALIERARAYEVAGLQAFVQELQRDWERHTLTPEGRSDASDDSVQIVTMHSSKGLEWPVVIPINTATRFRPPEEFVHRRSDDTLHWILGQTAPPELAAARAEENLSETRERERLWYVACTRARDLLIVPCLPSADDRSWCRIVDLGHDRLIELDLSGLPEPKPQEAAPLANEQTPERFGAEAEAVAAAAPPMTWRRPSDHDADRSLLAEGAVDPTNETAEVMIAPGAGRLRGIVLHKLMEEFLTGELEEAEASVIARARELLQQLVSAELESARVVPEPRELAATALRTLRLPEVATMRPNLVPELAVWAAAEGTLLAGRADAAAWEDDAPSVVLDWKSDVQPTLADRTQYRGQLQEYMAAVGAPRGAVVYMTLGEVAWV